MNDRQRLFVSEYLIDHNATQAAVRAGYSKRRANRTGYELLRKPEIAAAIDKAQQEIQKRNDITQDDLIAYAVDVIEKAAGLKPVRVGKDKGKVVLEYQFHPSAAIRGIESLAKQLGFNQPERHQVEHTGAVVYTLTLDRELPQLEEGENA